MVTFKTNNHDVCTFTFNDIAAECLTSQDLLIFDQFDSIARFGNPGTDSDEFVEVVTEDPETAAEWTANGGAGAGGVCTNMIVGY